MISNHVLLKCPVPAMQLPLKWMGILMNGFLLVLKTSSSLYTFYVAVKLSNSKRVGAGEIWQNKTIQNDDWESLCRINIFFLLNLACTFPFHLCLCPSYTAQKCHYTVPPVLVRVHVPPKHTYYGPPCLNKPLSLIYLHPPVSLN